MPLLINRRSPSPAVHRAIARATEQLPCHVRWRRTAVLSGSLSSDLLGVHGRRTRRRHGFGPRPRRSAPGGPGLTRVGRMVGEEFIGAMVAFLTIDVAAVRARGRLFIIGADVRYRPDTEDGSGPRRCDDGLPASSAALIALAFHIESDRGSGGHCRRLHSGSRSARSRRDDNLVALTHTVWHFLPNRLSVSTDLRRFGERRRPMAKFANPSYRAP